MTFVGFITAGEPLRIMNTVFCCNIISRCKAALMAALRPADIRIVSDPVTVL